MKKGCNSLCVLILVAFGFSAEAPALQGLGRTNLNSVSPIGESVVVIGSITSKILNTIPGKKGPCGVERKDDYSNIVVPLSRKHGLDWRLVTAVMAAESSFNPCAVSPKGAMGLMQIMPSVAKDFKVRPGNAFDPDENIRAGVLLLKRLKERYNGDLKLTIAAYNAGPGNVERYKGVPPFKETRQYVNRVLGYHSDLKVAKAKPYSGSPMKLLKAR